jgi:hypothetical protein
MATSTILDGRRTDQRTNVRVNPFWITSAELTKASDDKGFLFFSFPEALGDYFIHNVLFEVVTGFAGGTITIDIGLGTLATNDITTDGDVTIVDKDEYIVNTDIVHGTPGYYTPDGGDWFTAWLAGNLDTQIIAGADTTVPAIYATMVSDAAITAGSGYLHAMVSKLPKGGKLE